MNGRWRERERGGLPAMSPSVLAADWSVGLLLAQGRGTEVSY